MPKIVLSDEEKAIIQKYIEFLIDNPNPCDACPRLIRAECCGCPESGEWEKKVTKFKVESLLSIDMIKKYVDYSVNLDHIIKEIEANTRRRKKLENEIAKILENVDLEVNKEFYETFKNPIDVPEVPKRIYFNCTTCGSIYNISVEYCHDALGKGGRYKKYYPCPKCSNINFARND